MTAPWTRTAAVTPGETPQSTLFSWQDLLSSTQNVEDLNTNINDNNSATPTATFPLVFYDNTHHPLQQQSHHDDPDDGNADRIADTSNYITINSPSAAHIEETVLSNFPASLLITSTASSLTIYNASIAVPSTSTFTPAETATSVTQFDNKYHTVFPTARSAVDSTHGRQLQSDEGAVYEARSSDSLSFLETFSNTDFLTPAAPFTTPSASRCSIHLDGVQDRKRLDIDSFAECASADQRLSDGGKPISKDKTKGFQATCPSSTSGGDAGTGGDGWRSSSGGECDAISVTSRRCDVCGEPGNGNYFGAFVCLPCKDHNPVRMLINPFYPRYGDLRTSQPYVSSKSFFIRCTKERYPEFSTGCGGRCGIQTSGRIRCQFCRFQKCLSAGMYRKVKPEAVVPEEGQVLCKVCSDVANGIHFGVATCEGCKKFFRRGLKEHPTYICKATQMCTINPRMRNSCRYCRYQKCIRMGMSREAIKMGRPKKGDQAYAQLYKPYSAEAVDRKLTYEHDKNLSFNEDTEYKPSGSEKRAEDGGQDLGCFEDNFTLESVSDSRYMSDTFLDALNVGLEDSTDNNPRVRIKEYTREDLTAGHQEGVVQNVFTQCTGYNQRSPGNGQTVSILLCCCASEDSCKCVSPVTSCNVPSYNFADNFPHVSLLSSASERNERGFHLFSRPAVHVENTCEAKYSAPHNQRKKPLLIGRSFSQNEGHTGQAQKMTRRRQRSADVWPMNAMESTSASTSNLKKITVSSKQGVETGSDEFDDDLNELLDSLSDIPTLPHKATSTANFPTIFNSGVSGGKGSSDVKDNPFITSSRKSSTAVRGFKFARQENQYSLTDSAQGCFENVKRPRLEPSFYLNENENTDIITKGACSNKVPSAHNTRSDFFARMNPSSGVTGHHPYSTGSVSVLPSEKLSVCDLPGRELSQTENLSALYPPFSVQPFATALPALPPYSAVFRHPSSKSWCAEIPEGYPGSDNPLRTAFKHKEKSDYKADNSVLQIRPILITSAPTIDVIAMPPLLCTSSSSTHGNKYQTNSLFSLPSVMSSDTQTPLTRGAHPTQEKEVVTQPSFTIQTYSPYAYSPNAVLPSTFTDKITGCLSVRFDRNRRLVSKESSSTMIHSCNTMSDSVVGTGVLMSESNNFSQNGGTQPLLVVHQSKIAPNVTAMLSATNNAVDFSEDLAQTLQEINHYFLSLDNSCEKNDCGDSDNRNTCNDNRRQSDYRTAEHILQGICLSRNCEVCHDSNDKSAQAAYVSPWSCAVCTRRHHLYWHCHNTWLRAVPTTASSQHMLNCVAEGLRQFRHCLSSLHAQEEQKCASDYLLLTKLSHQDDAIAAITKNFLSHIPGVKTLSSEDTDSLCQRFGFDSAFIVLSSQAFDADCCRFQKLWSWTVDPASPLFFLKKQMLAVAGRLHAIGMNNMETALLCALSLISTDLFGLKRREAIHDVRISLLNGLVAYISSRDQWSKVRIQRLFSVLPEVRVLSAWLRAIVSRSRLLPLPPYASSLCLSAREVCFRP